MLMSKETIVAEKFAHQLTLDITWKQIIGLNLKTKDYMEHIHENVRLWMKALSNFALFALPIPAKLLKTMKACKEKQYLGNLIEG